MRNIESVNEKTLSGILKVQPYANSSVQYVNLEYN